MKVKRLDSNYIIQDSAVLIDPADKLLLVMGVETGEKYGREDN